MKGESLMFVLIVAFHLCVANRINTNADVNLKPKTASEIRTHTVCANPQKGKREPWFYCRVRVTCSRPRYSCRPGQQWLFLFVDVSNCGAFVHKWSKNIRGGRLDWRRAAHTSKALQQALCFMQWSTDPSGACVPLVGPFVDTFAFVA